jgi:hypothetical protein
VPFVLFVVEGCCYAFVRQTINAGRTTKVQNKVKPIPMVSNMPMLAIPRWGDTARLPKLHTVVNELYNTARAVLVCNI